MRIVVLAAGAIGAVGATANMTFDVTAAYNAKHRSNLVNTYARVYKKYNATLPEPIAAAAELQRQQQNQIPGKDSFGARDEGSSTAWHSGFYDGEYLCQVAIGTPPQNFYLNLDTGSSDLWVYGAEIPKAFLSGQRQYRHENSSTAKLDSLDVWFGGYVDFSFVGGVVYTDTVSIGDDDSKDKLVVEKQGVQVAQVVAKSISEDSGMEGILGLGFDKLNFAWPTKQKTWFTNVRDKLKEPLFTVDFRHKAEGKYTFGYIDEKALAGPLVYTPVDAGTGYWYWSSTGYAIGTKPLTKRTIKGTLDTGTTMNLFPEDVVKEYYGQVPGSTYSSVEHGYIFNCTYTLPDFTFGVEDSHITIPGHYMLSAYTDSQPGMCIGSIQKGSDNTIIFGAPSLKAGLAVFDAGKLRIGWANKTLTS